MQNPEGAPGYWVFFHRMVSDSTDSNAYFKSRKVMWQAHSEMLYCCPACQKGQLADALEDMKQSASGEGVGCTLAVITWVIVIVALVLGLCGMPQMRNNCLQTIVFFAGAGVLLSWILFMVGKYTAKAFTKGSRQPVMSIDDYIEREPRVRKLLGDGWKKGAFPEGVEDGPFDNDFWFNSPEMAESVQKKLNKCG